MISGFKRYGTWRKLAASPTSGSVNVGIHLKSISGRMLNNDHARLPVSTEPVRVGETLEISGTIPLPDIEDFQLEVDLVAEAIVWFEFVGSQPVKLHFRKRAYVDNS